MITQSREKLRTFRIAPKGTVSSGPFWCRSCRDLTEIFSTVPFAMPMSMYSPRRKASSIRKNAPEKMSLIRVCAPKPIARPTTPAPANSGPMLMPISDSPIITAITTIVASAKPRSK